MRQGTEIGWHCPRCAIGKHYTGHTRPSGGVHCHIQTFTSFSQHLEQSRWSAVLIPYLEQPITYQCGGRCEEIWPFDMGGVTALQLLEHLRATVSELAGISTSVVYGAITGWVTKVVEIEKWSSSGLLSIAVPAHQCDGARVRSLGVELREPCFAEFALIAYLNWSTLHIVDRCQAPLIAPCIPTRVSSSRPADLLHRTQSLLRWAIFSMAFSSFWYWGHHQQSYSNEAQVTTAFKDAVWDN